MKTLPLQNSEFCNYLHMLKKLPLWNIIKIHSATLELKSFSLRRFPLYISNVPQSFLLHLLMILLVIPSLSCQTPEHAACPSHLQLPGTHWIIPRNKSFRISPESDKSTPPNWVNIPSFCNSLESLKALLSLLFLFFNIKR